jgi:hypothetical protein
MIKLDLRETGWGLWSGFTWLKIGIRVVLWMRWWTFGFWHHGVSYSPVLCNTMPPSCSRLKHFWHSCSIFICGLGSHFVCFVLDVLQRYFRVCQIHVPVQ